MRPQTSEVRGQEVNMQTYRLYSKIYPSAYWSGLAVSDLRPQTSEVKPSRFWSGLVSDLIQRSGKVRIEVKRFGSGAYVNIYDKIGRLVWSRCYSRFWSAKRGALRFCVRYGLVIV